MARAMAAMLILLPILVQHAVAQGPPEYSDVPPDSMATSSRTTYVPSSYTLTNPACTGTSAICPCASGYACRTIADCHWKCLMTMTSFPSSSYATTTTPQSVPASETSAPAQPTTSVPGGGSNTPSSMRASTPSVTMPPSSAATGGASSSPPMPTSSDSQSGGGSPNSGGQGASSSMDGDQGGSSQTGGGPGGTSQGGGNQSSTGGEGGSTRTGGKPTGTAGSGDTTVTVTEYPSTCEKQTGTSTLTTTDYVTSCPATCLAK